ncbi:MAG: DNA-methyltransferase [Candidatus Helarchaeota archaeon]
MLEINKIYCTDCLEGLRKLDDNSVDCIITSPPYWGLRRYTDKLDIEIGNEEHPQEYINKIVKVCIECMRVLKPTGNFFLNLGDSYGTHRNVKDAEINISNEKKLRSLVARNAPRKSLRSNWFQEKQKLLIPHRIAIALQDLGFIVRDDNVWVKKLTIYSEEKRGSIGSTLPFPVKDRLLSSTEYIFHIVKSKKYYFNLKNVKLPIKKSSVERAKRSFSRYLDENPYTNHKGLKEYYEKISRIEIGGGVVLGENWNVGRINVEEVLPTNAIMFKRRNQFLKKGFQEHFATFPETLVKFFIEIGCPVDGLVLDPFAGVGTTLVVAKYSGRNYIGFEISKKFVDIINSRLSQKTLMEVKDNSPQQEKLITLSDFYDN